MSEELTKILYLEDDMSIAEIGQMALVDVAGMTVRHCATAKDAIEQYELFQPELLLFDYMLPDMDGLSTYKALEEKYGDSVAPVIFMTGKSQPQDREHYMAEGALSVIIKPFDTFTLGEKLSALWRQRKPRSGYTDQREAS